MKFRYTDDHIKFLRAGYKKMTSDDLAASFNKKFGLDKPKTAIKSALSNRGITCGRGSGRLKGTYRLFTKKQANFIKRNYKRLSQVDLAAVFNKKFGTTITPGQIRSFTRNHRIKSGRTGCFEKGHKPWNTGTKGICKPNSGCFEKGHKPVNHKPLWSERVGKDGYIEMKVPEKDPYTGFPTRHKQKHVWIYEQDNGPVPKGFAVIFKDGNKLNFDKKNLILVSKAELLSMNLHGYKKQPAELKPSVLALAKLETKVGIRTRPARRRSRS